MFTPRTPFSAAAVHRPHRLQIARAFQAPNFNLQILCHLIGVQLMLLAAKCENGLAITAVKSEDIG